MAKIGVHRALLTVPLPWRVKALGMAAAACLPALAALAATAMASRPAIVAAATAAAALALLGLYELLAPIGRLSVLLERCAPPLRIRWPDEARRMLVQAGAIEAELSAARRGGAPPTAAAPNGDTELAMAERLKGALKRGELFLNFQPVVDLAAARVAGAEALLRWRDPELGLVSPARFVPMMEEGGLMEEVGLWVLDQACQQARCWRESGLPGMTMAVNLSARQLREGSLLTEVEATLRRHKLTPEDLELELTESAAIVDDDSTRRLLGGLRALGVSVAIDDFGAGYSSLSNLRRLPFSRLKIDREFVAAVDASPDNHAICGALVELARGLSIDILAEGAETKGEVETLRGLGCSKFQGYFFSRPLAPAEFVTTVEDPEWLALLASPVHREIARLKRQLAN